MAAPHTPVVVYFLLYLILNASGDESDNCTFTEADEDQPCVENNFGESENWSMFIPGDYDKAHVPVQMAKNDNGRALPLKVYFAASVQTVSPIMASETEFRVNMKLILKWVDTRLKQCTETNSTEEEILSMESLNRLWLPSPFVVNAKRAEIKRLDRKLIGVKVSNKGIVTLSFVLNATVDCVMNFKWYPLDSQTCPMHIESFSYDDSFVDYNWLPNKPFQILPRRLLQFEVAPKFQYSKSSVFRKYLARNFTRITVFFKFRRLLASHILQTAVPCSLVVILSWFSFWMVLDVTSARASLLMTAMLTLVLQFAYLRTDLPPVAYVKGVDIWMFGCMFYIFAALAEFILVKVIYSVTERIRKENLVQTMSSSLTKSWSRSETLVFYPRECVPSQDLARAQIYCEPVPMAEPCYKKKRLGSVVFSGRSIATSHLPQIDLYIFSSWRIPLVWNDPQDEASPQPKYVMWREIDIICRSLFPATFFLFSLGYWVTLIVFGTMDSLDSF